MIEENELRVNNYYRYPNSNPFKLEISDLSGKLIEDLDIIEPIKITNEILVLFGFENKSGGEYVKDRFTYRNRFSDLIVRGYEFDYNGIICYPLYVHHLQNIYFALTGEELIFL